MILEKAYQWQGRNILIVEDDDSSSFLLGEILRPTGATISFAYNGVDAVDFIKEHPKTDLVLMDIQLPEKDGLTATREIKAINQKVLVIAQSAYTHFVNADHAGNVGADDFLSKPINLKLLISKIDNVFS